MQYVDIFILLFAIDPYKMEIYARRHVRWKFYGRATKNEES